MNDNEIYWTRKPRSRADSLSLLACVIASVVSIIMIVVLTWA